MTSSFPLHPVLTSREPTTHNMTMGSIGHDICYSLRHNNIFILQHHNYLCLDCFVTSYISVTPAPLTVYVVAIPVFRLLHCKHYGFIKVHQPLSKVYSVIILTKILINPVIFAYNLGTLIVIGQQNLFQTDGDLS